MGADSSLLAQFSLTPRRGGGELLGFFSVRRGSTRGVFAELRSSCASASLISVVSIQSWECV